MTDKTVNMEEQENRGGEIRIANDVISVIAGMALCELPGIYIDGRAPESFVDKANAKNITKTIKIEMSEGNVAVNIVVSVEYGKIISEICREIQEKIKSAVQTMTGLTVSRVDITVSDLVFKKGEQKK